MKKLLTFLLLIFMGSIFPQEKKELTLKDIFLTNKFTSVEIENVQWFPSGEAFTFTKTNNENRKDIWKHDVETGNETLFLKSNELVFNNSPINMSSYNWTDDEKYLLIRGPVTSIWRHSKMSPVYLFDLETKKIAAIADEHTGLKNVKLSPDGNFAGYVKEHNLYVVELSSGKETQLTFDGNENILNGEFDWVYEEEFAIADGWRWSPDGSKIAFWKFDQTRVKEFYLVDEMHPYNKVMPLKYPKVGEQNAIVNIAVIDLKTGETKMMDTGSDDDIYLPRIYWGSSSDQLSILRLNRRQNKLDLLIADTESRKSNIVLTETDAGWIDIEDNHLTFINDKNDFLWVSEQSGFRHIYHYDFSGNKINPVTEGNWEITSLQGYSMQDNYVYFYGKKESEIEQHIYRVKLDGTGMEKISGFPGWHTANFSPGYKYFIHSYSTAKHPSKFYLRKSDGELIRTLNKNDLPAFDEFDLVYPEFKTLQTSDGVTLNYMMTKPNDFDPNKKYPVIVFGYGGPGSQRVINEWYGSRQLFHTLLAQKGFIVFTIDNRGTGGRGKAFKNLMYKDLSKYPVIDHIEAAKYLSTLHYVDSERLGVWGWSGGGTLTIWLMTRAADYFKVGVAVASNTDFRLYDAIWSERFMSLLEDNAEGYEEAAPVTYAHLLKGKLLLVHGTEDDNVHYQHTMQMVKALQDEGKMFDLMLYPGKNHSITGGEPRVHLYKTIMNYFLDNL